MIKIIKFMLFKRKKISFKDRIYEILFGEKTELSRIINIFLIFFILTSTLLVIIESNQVIATKYAKQLFIAEFIFIMIFGIEYILRIYSAKSKKKYIFSFYGVIDFIAVFPALISIFFSPFYYLLILRSLRVFRVFRILKVVSILEEENVLTKSIRRSIPKILIFLIFVLIISIIFSSVMYLVEGPENGFKDIPTTLYWTIVTITTVGYGDIVPVTNLGKFLASIIMLSGYGIIAVPTGIVVSEYNKLNFINRFNKNK